MFCQLEWYVSKVNRNHFATLGISLLLLHFHSNVSMPISLKLPVKRFSQEDFGKVAYEVVSHAFGVHASLGKKFHECVYREALSQTIGQRTVTEFAISLTHKTFEKELYVDLLVDSGCPFELKAVTKFSETHVSQLIQYLMLLDLRHGKLMNFGAEKVDHQFVNCLESRKERQ